MTVQPTMEGIRDAVLLAIADHPDAGAGDRRVVESMLGELLRDHRSWLAWARRCLVRRGLLTRQVEPSDVLQESCLRAIVRARGCRATTIRQARAWFRRMVQRTVSELARRCGRDRRIASAMAVPLGGHEEGLLEASGGADACDEAASKEGVSRLLDAISSLPDKESCVLLDVALSGRSAKDVALALGQSEAAVRSILQRARARLRSVVGRRRDAP